MNYPSYPIYKDSCVEWLGALPEHWDVKRLKYLCQIQTGNKDTINAVEDGLYPFFVRSQTVERINSHTFDCEAILTAGDGVGVGKVFHHYIGAFDFHQRVYMLNNFQDVVGFFLFLFIKEHFYRVALEGNAKSTVDSLRMPLFLNFPVPVPSVSEQHAIVAFVRRETNRIDDLIAKQERMVELLVEKRCALISQALTRGIHSNVVLKESGLNWLGMVPEHWQIIKTKYLFQPIVEFAPENNDLELLSVYTDIGVKPRRELEARGNKASTTDGYLTVEKGDIIVNKLLAWMGAMGVSDYSGVTSPAYDILRNRVPLNSYFYHHLFRCGLYFTEFRRWSRGIMDMRLRLYFDQFGQILLPYPPKIEQDAIVDYINRETTKIDALISKARQSIELMNEHRASLIAAAVTGKIDVRDR